MKDKYFEGVGRRKTSTARVRVYLGDKASTVNGVAVDTYFSTTPVAVDTAMKAFRVIDSDGKYYFSATVNGGGLNAQADSISLGLSRALCKMDDSFKSSLRKAGLVTRDSREVERKNIIILSLEKSLSSQSVNVYRIESVRHLMGVFFFSMIQSFSCGYFVHERDRKG